MRQYLIAIALLASFCPNARAQTVKIDLYSDANRTSCELSDQGTALRTIYLFAMGTSSISGLRLYAPKPDCWIGASWIADILPQPAGTLGNSQTDWNISYGICRTPPALAGQINYLATGGSLPCCLASAKDPGNITDEVGNVIHRFVWYDCAFGEHTLQPGQSLVINPDNSCRCQSPLAAENSTWGRVKSLYR